MSINRMRRFAYWKCYLLNLSISFIRSFIELYMSKTSLVLRLKEEKVKGKGKIVSRSQWPRSHRDCGFESPPGDMDICLL